ncbi:hypothetical protein TWF106_004756 [Orbilia oligospora]|uniref:Velvet domain-containing protein n=1 Tax=Orbilia oligospora TaxID=2813651 RepID=A0A7C8U8L7_ORBOL|nr:hypothetical protein TWF788_000601 [Orbilia oligospora]KAF3198162.1 hypothetical protein TWF106_004756 [Orbilia oligospora]KAF3200768.1 hypothetical protein TWF679_000674 [Orbilia oligospora]KAF3217932.1 hypothetical protein TWF191_008349 [Orbilia oligospora]
MMSPRPPPQPPPPPLTHLRQILTPERSEAASSLSHSRPVPPLLPPPPLPRTSPNVPPVKTTEVYSYNASHPSYRPFPPPPPPRSLLSHAAGSPSRVRTNLAPPLPIHRRPPVPYLPEAPYHFNPDVGRIIAQPEPYAIELEQGRRRSIPPPPLYPLSEGTAVSPESDFAAPRYVQPIGHLAGQSRSPRDRRLSNTPLSQSPGPSYTTGNKRTFEETLSPAHKPASLQNTPRGSFSSELELLRSILPPRPMSDNLRLVVRQQPVAARACGFGERDRRVIDPPPIVQLVASDPSNPSSESDVRYPFNVVHCTLWNVAGTADETALEQQDKRLTRRLMGTLVASPFIGQDENNEDGTFFCFPDLSCRTHGKFRLKFVLMCIDPMGQQASYTPVTTEVMSDVFTVYTAKEFPGMRPSTGLTKALKQQGCAISVKKGNEKASQASPQEEDEEKSGEGDDSDQDTASRGKRRRKA